MKERYFETENGPKIEIRCAEYFNKEFKSQAYFCSRNAMILAYSDGSICRWHRGSVDCDGELLKGKRNRGRWDMWKDVVGGFIDCTVIEMRIKPYVIFGKTQVEFWTDKKTARLTFSIDDELIDVKEGLY